MKCFYKTETERFSKSFSKQKKEIKRMPLTINSLDYYITVVNDKNNIKSNKIIKKNQNIKNHNSFFDDKKDIKYKLISDKNYDEKNIPAQKKFNSLFNFKKNWTKHKVLSTRNEGRDNTKSEERYYKLKEYSLMTFCEHKKCQKYLFGRTLQSFTNYSTKKSEKESLNSYYIPSISDKESLLKYKFSNLDFCLRKSDISFNPRKIMNYGKLPSKSKNDNFIEYIKSKSNFLYVNKQLKDLTSQYKINIGLKEDLIKREIYKNICMKPLIKFFFSSIDDYIQDLKSEIKKGLEMNEFLKTNKRTIKFEFLDLDKKAKKLLRLIKKYKDIKEFLEKVKDYGKSIQQKEKQKKIIKEIDNKKTKIEEPFITSKLETISDFNFSVDEFFKIYNKLKDNISKLLIEQAQIINELEPLKEEYKETEKILKENEIKLMKLYKDEIFTKNRKLKDIKVKNKILMKSMNIAERMSNNKNLNMNFNRIEKVLKEMYNNIKKQNIIPQNDEIFNNPCKKDNNFSSTKIINYLKITEKCLVILFQEKIKLKSLYPEVYINTLKEINEKKKKDNIIKSRLEEMESKLKKLKKLDDKLNKTYYVGFKKDYLPFSIPRKNQENKDNNFNEYEAELTY